MSWEAEVGLLQRQIEALRQRVVPAVVVEPPRVPGVMEFVLSSEFLAKPTLFPRQATLLKVLFLEHDALTPYDLEVLEEWRHGFVAGDYDELFEGRWFEPAPDREFTVGTTPDILQRIALVKARGRRCFKHLNVVGGRRAGKGELASDAIAFLVWQLIGLGEPQPHVNAARGKVLTVDIFAGNAQQARENVFADVVRTIVSAPCFTPYVQSLTRDRLVLATPFDLQQVDRARAGTIEIVARETTVLSGRGPSAVLQVFDEFGWIEPSTSHTSADELYAAATPALDQARGWSLSITMSSPYQRAGKFYELHRLATEIDEVTGTAAYPDMVTFQLPSWSPYVDAEHATNLPLVADDAAVAGSWLRDDTGAVRSFPFPGGAPVVYDDEMRDKQCADPIRFRVENGGQWADVADPLLYPHWIERVFRLDDGTTLNKQHRGSPAVAYRIHIDPSTRRDPFAYVIAHSETIKGELVMIIDCIRRWVPDGADLDLEQIYKQLDVDILNFRPTTITIDQHGGLFMVTEIRKRIAELPIPQRIDVYDTPHTARGNRQLTDVFREAIKRRLLRSYPDRQLELELRFLQDINGTAKAPTSGPVTTDDVAIATMVLTHQHLADGTATHEQLSGLSPIGLNSRALFGNDPATDDIAERFSNAMRPRPPQRHNPARGRWYRPR